MKYNTTHKMSNKELLFHGQDWIEIKEKQILGNRFSASMEFRLTETGAGGLLICTNTNVHDLDKQALFLHVSRDPSVPEKQYIRVFQHRNLPSDDIELKIPGLISVIEWHKVSFKRDGNSWTLVLDDKVVTYDKKSSPLYDDIMFIGGNTFAKPFTLTNTCVRNIIINDKFIDLKNYDIPQSITQCPPGPATPLNPPIHIRPPTPLNPPIHIRPPTPLNPPIHIRPPTPLNPPIHIRPPTPLNPPIHIRPPTPLGPPFVLWYYAAALAFAVILILIYIFTS
jgi:hypothetical protein